MTTADGVRHVEGTDGIGYDVPANAVSPVLEQVPQTVPPCPYPRHFSYVTGEYTISLRWADFDALMDDVFALWDLGDVSEKASDMFEALIDRLAAMREHTNTGWGGTPLAANGADHGNEP